MNKLYYDTRYNVGHIIEDYNNKIRSIILEKLGPNQVLIDSKHLEITNELIRFVKINKGKQFLIYSSIDWESTKCRPEVHEYLNSEIQNLVYIGNTNNEFYFSFWLDFVNANKEQYINLEPLEFSKVFMCLNRKPHNHRVMLVKSIIDNDLQDNGYISLGLENETYKGVNFPLKLNEVADSDDIAMYGNYATIPNDILSLGKTNNWNSHLINVVTETTIHTDVFLSEKVFKPILGMRPFIILGDQSVYSKLQDFGFDTFDDIFGTGYLDDNYEHRIKWIVNVIDNHKNIDAPLFAAALKNRLQNNFNVFESAAYKNFNLINREWSKI